MCFIFGGKRIKNDDRPLINIVTKHDCLEIIFQDNNLSGNVEMEEKNNKAGTETDYDDNKKDAFVAKKKKFQLIMLN